MTSESQQSSAVHCYRVSSQQLLSGLVVAIMFLLVAVAGLRSSNETQLTPQTSSSITNNQQQFLAGIRSARTGDDRPRSRKLKSAEILASDYFQNSSSEASTQVQSALMKIDLSDISTTAKSASSLTQILKLIARNGRLPTRSYCFQTSSDVSLQKVLPLASLMVEHGSLTADQLSFRVTSEIPSDEVWLEIRATPDLETVAAR